MSKKRINRPLKIILLIFIVALIVAVALYITNYRNKTIIIELSLYSGNSWGVPQNFAYIIYDRAVEMFEKRYKEEGYRVKLRTGTMYKDYSSGLPNWSSKGRRVTYSSSWRRTSMLMRLSASSPTSTNISSKGS